VDQLRHCCGPDCLGFPEAHTSFFPPRTPKTSAPRLQELRRRKLKRTDSFAKRRRSWRGWSRKWSNCARRRNEKRRRRRSGLRAITQSDIQKVGLAGKAEIEAAERAARLELKAIAANLAVDGAESLLVKQLTPQAQESLMAALYEGPRREAELKVRRACSTRMRWRILRWRRARRSQLCSNLWASALCTPTRASISRSRRCFASAVTAGRQKVPAPRLRVQSAEAHKLLHSWLRRALRHRNIRQRIRVLQSSPTSIRPPFEVLHKRGPSAIPALVASTVFTSSDSRHPPPDLLQSPSVPAARPLCGPISALPASPTFWMSLCVIARSRSALRRRFSLRRRAQLLHFLLHRASFSSASRSCRSASAFAAVALVSRS